MIFSGFAKKGESMRVKRRMSESDLDEIIAKHQKWLELYNSVPKYIVVEAFDKDIKADLRDAIIEGYDFHRANLSMVDLTGACIINCKMVGAILEGATLIDTYIENTDMTSVVLTESCIFKCMFRRVTLDFANFAMAVIDNVKFMACQMYLSTFSGASTHELVFSNNTNVDGCKNLVAPMACPDTGSFIGWKKAMLHPLGMKYVMVKLEIPEDARRSSAGGRKCRCDKAKVLSITDLSGTTSYPEAFSIYDSDFKYVVGKTVSVDNFDDNRWNECSAGIHFFINRDEVVAY